MKNNTDMEKIREIEKNLNMLVKQRADGEISQSELKRSLEKSQSELKRSLEKEMASLSE